jgi:hypothetical protein
MAFNLRSSCRLGSVAAFAVLGCALTSCNSGSSTDGKAIQTLELRIRELEAELENRSDTASTENAEPMSPEASSSVVASAPTTAPLELSRETLAALRDCQGKAYMMVEYSLEDGRLLEFYLEDSDSFKEFRGSYEKFRDSCQSAGRQLDLDILQFGSHTKSSSVKERVLDFNLQFVSFDLAVAGLRPSGQLEVFDWAVVEAFPGYLSGFLESYKNG